MSVYKVTFEAMVPGFFGPKTISGIELYEADNYMAAQKLAEAEIEKAKREVSARLSSSPVFLIKNIEKVE